jgi:hypothetical protein
MDRRPGDPDRRRSGSHARAECRNRGHLPSPTAFGERVDKAILKGKQKGLHFMATRFIEVLPNRGVDDNLGPIPEMIVPLRGTNHILLIDGRRCPTSREPAYARDCGGL